VPEPLRYLTISCPPGHVLVAAEGERLAFVLLGHDPARLEADLLGRTQGRYSRREPALAPLLATLTMRLRRGRAHPKLPCLLRGSPFELAVFRALLAIPVGTTESYGALAARLGAPRATRAVAQACGRNPLAFLVPCHRVIRANGDLGGYHFGLAWKRALLAAEGCRLAALGVSE